MSAAPQELQAPVEGATRKRSCVACRQKMDQARLNRVVMHEGKATADPSGKLAGRGAYVCSSLRCLKDAIRSGGFCRALRIKNSGAEPMVLANEFVMGLRMQHERLTRAGALSSDHVKHSKKRDALLFRLGKWESEVDHTR